MALEGSQQSEEDGEGELKHLWKVRHTVLGEGNTEVLFYSSDEYFIGAEYRARVLDDGEEEFEREQLGTQLMGPAWMWREIGSDGRRGGEE